VETLAPLWIGPTNALSTVRPRAVYTYASLQLARLVGRKDGRWKLEVGAELMAVEGAPAVDLRLLEQGLERGGRVLAESTPASESTIAGVVQTQRAVTDEHRRRG